MQEGIEKGNKVLEVNINDIDLDNKQFQLRVEMDVRDLVKSIEKEGQKIPVILRGKEPPYQIICGFRRITALKKLGREKVKAIIYPELDDEEAIRLSVIENLKRKTYNVFDKVYIFEYLKAQGKSNEEIARVFGLSEKQISRYAKIREFPEELKKAVLEERIALKPALVIFRYWKKYPEKIDLKEVIEKLAKGELGSTEEVKKYLIEKTWGIRKKKRYFRKLPDGFRIYAFSYRAGRVSEREKEEMTNALREALRIISGYTETVKKGERNSEEEKS